MRHSGVKAILTKQVFRDPSLRRVYDEARAKLQARAQEVLGGAIEGLADRIEKGEVVGLKEDGTEERLPARMRDLSMATQALRGVATRDEGQDVEGEERLEVTAEKAGALAELMRQLRAHEVSSGMLEGGVGSVVRESPGGEEEG